MKVAAISIFKLIINLIYRILCLFIRPGKQIVYLSRQSDHVSQDVTLLSAQLKKDHPEYRQIFRFRMIHGGMIAKICYCLGLVGDIYYLAGSSIAVCDTYSIPVSCLNLRKEIKVIQMWHAMGATKEFGWQSLGKEDGRDQKTSEAMNMHGNYDYVLAPSEATGLFYQKAFHVPAEKIRIMTLPHMDAVMDGKDRRAEFEKLYPQAKGKKLIIYVPTFRPQEEKIVASLREAFDAAQKAGNLQDYMYFTSLHPLTRISDPSPYAIRGGFDSMSLIKMADTVITDYSACAYESACLNKRLYFYVPDLEEYRISRGLNVDLKHELPNALFTDAAALIDAVEKRPYDQAALAAFAHRYVENTENCTEKLADFIAGLMS